MRAKNSKKFVKLRQETKLLWALILALVAALLWIAISIFSPKKEQVISLELRKIAEPLNPSLNQEVLNSLQARSYFQDSELETFSIFGLIETESGGVFELTDIVNQRSISIEPQEQMSESVRRNNELLRMYSQPAVENEPEDTQEPIGIQEAGVQNNQNL